MCQSKNLRGHVVKLNPSVYKLQSQSNTHRTQQPQTNMGHGSPNTTQADPQLWMQELRWGVFLRDHIGPKNVFGSEINRASLT